MKDGFLGGTLSIFKYMWASSSRNVYFVTSNQLIQNIQCLTNPELTVKIPTSKLVSHQPINNLLYFTNQTSIHSFNIETGDLFEQYLYGKNECITSVTKHSDQKLFVLNSQGNMMICSNWNFSKIGSKVQGIEKIKFLNKSQVLQKISRENEDQIDQISWRVFNIQYNATMFQFNRRSIRIFDNIKQYNKDCLFLSLFDFDENTPETCIIDRRSNRKIFRIMDTDLMQISPQNVQLVNSKIVGIGSLRREIWKSVTFYADLRFGNKIINISEFKGRPYGLCTNDSLVYSCFYEAVTNQSSDRINRYVKNLYVSTL